MLIKFIEVIRQHRRRGTVLDALLGKFGLQRKIRLPKWYGTHDSSAATSALLGEIIYALGSGPVDGKVLIIGDDSPVHTNLLTALKERQLPYESAALRSVGAIDVGQASSLIGVYCASASARYIDAVAREVQGNDALRKLPFEYIAGLDQAYQDFRKFDEYSAGFFVSPVLLDDPNPYQIYRESLAHFRQKCGLRDYLDLYQVLRGVVAGGVEGDIAEFGSYEGHSGWLIARTLQALGSDKKLYMFDAFDAFPAEELGIDQFWSRTHKVDFQVVQEKLASFSNVQLVRGDITQTLPASGLNRLALAYVDCDSYRATRFLYDNVFDQHLSQKGALVCEDYGHPALLGSRLAVHEGLFERSNAVSFFSQFSGLYITFKA